jgi:hypothetical protein
VRHISNFFSTAKKCTGTYIFDARIGFYAKFGSSGVLVLPCENSLLSAKIDVLVKVALSEASGRHKVRRAILEKISIFGKKCQIFEKSRFLQKITIFRKNHDFLIFFDFFESF